jgi:hypothetical protein
VQLLNFRLAVTYLALLVAGLGIVGCWSGLNSPRKDAQETVIRVDPCDLFQGHVARLEPHLHFSATVCAKIEFQGKNLPIRIELLVWHNGEPVKVPGPLNEILRGPSEITFSMRRDGTCKDGNDRYLVTIALPGRTSSFQMCKPALQDDWGGASSQRLRETAELSSEKPVALFRMIAGKGSNQWSSDESFVATAKRVEWGMVLQVSLRELDELQKWHSKSRTLEDVRQKMREEGYKEFVGPDK